MQKKGAVMRSESKKSFRHGFELTEQELRRIIDVLMQQIGRVPQASTPATSFEIKFRNGVIAEPASLEEILSLENIGSGAIVRLQIWIDDGQSEPVSAIGLEFVNADADSDGEDKSIRYTITGDDRDWVFVTSSQLEERISKIRRSSIVRSLKSREAFLLVPMAIIFSLLVALFSGMNNQGVALLRGIDTIESHWKGDGSTDPVNVILALERLKAKEQSLDLFSRRGMLFPMLVCVPAVILLYAGVFAWSYYFPSYNFMWGDYVRYVQKRKRSGSFIFGGVILAIALSILGNYISSLLGIRRERRQWPPNDGSGEQRSLCSGTGTVCQKWGANTGGSRSFCR